MTTQDEVRPHLEFVAGVLGIKFVGYGERPADMKDETSILMIWGTPRGEKFICAVPPHDMIKVRPWAMDIGAQLRMYLFDWRKPCPLTSKP